MPADSLTLAKTCAACAQEIQAENVVVMDLRGISSLSDFFVVCSGTSIPHLKAIMREVRANVADQVDESPRSAEGDATSLWMVIDYVDVMVHIFHDEKREQYSLEDLWSDAPRIEVEASA